MKTSIEKTPKFFLGFVIDRNPIKPLNKWLILFLFLFLFFPLLTSCRPSCGDSPEFNTYNCNKHTGHIFSACIKKNFPVGSSFSDLDKYLTNLCLTRDKFPESYGKNSFSFRWESDRFPPTPYGVVVGGHYDAQLKITDIGFFPNPSGSDIKPLPKSQKRIPAK